MKRSITVLLCIWFLCLPVCALAAERTYSYSQIQHTVITPATTWAKPLSRSKIDALVITSAFGQRDILELSERLDIICTVAAVPYADRPGGDNAAQTALQPQAWEYLREKLKRPYDVIIIGALRWTFIPEDIREILLRHIEAGCGLLYVDPQGLDRKLFETFERGKINASLADIANTIPFSRLSAFAGFNTAESLAAKYMSKSQAGKGKLFFLRYRSGDFYSLTPRGASTFIEYDYYMSLLSKVILHLVGRTATTGIAAVKVIDDICRIELNGSIKEPMNLVLTLRDNEGKSEAGISKEISMPSGTRLDIPLPYLPAGIHYLDVQLKNKETVADWKSVAWERPAPVVMTVSLDKNGYQVGERITGNILLDKEQPGSIIKISLEDSLGRLIFCRELPARQKVQFAIPDFQPLAVLHTIKAELYRQENKIMDNAQSFPVRLQKDPSDFFYLLWGNASSCRSYPERNILKLARTECSVDAVLTRMGDASEDAKELSRLNLYMVPYIYSLYPKPISKKLERSPCLTDPSFRERMARNLQTTTRSLMPYAPMFYSLGDENGLAHERGDQAGPDICFSKTCVHSLQAELKRAYTTLDALNSEWDSVFNSWDEAIPSTLQALKAGKAMDNLAPWLDHRVHMDSVFADIHRFGREAIEEVDPDARVGAEGFFYGGGTGVDYYKLGKAMSMAGGYGGTRQWSAFLPEKAPLWDWGLYGRGIEYGRRFAWKILQDGGNGAGFFSAFAAEGNYAAFGPDYIPTDQFAALTEEVKRIKNGFGKLLLSGQAQYSPIAVIYSPLNEHLARALSLRRGDFSVILDELWYYPSILASEQIAAGKLQEGKHKCLILPTMHALSSEAREAIKRFVREGGLLIADVLPGQYDGHGKIAAANDMEEVFGVTRAGLNTRPDNSLQIDGQQYAFALADNLKPTTGKALGISPGGSQAVIMNSYGRGAALCLNILLYNYRGMKKEERARLRQIISTALTRADAPAEFVVAKETTEGSEPLYSGTGRYFLSDKNSYAFIMPHEEGKVTVKLPISGHLYNMTEGIYLGKDREFKTIFSRTDPCLISILPYKVSGISLACNKAATPGELVHVEGMVHTDGSAPGSHVLRIDIYDPTGKPLPCYSMNLLCPQGKGSFSIPLALNDKPGNWQITARDVATGTHSQVQLTVNKK